jgi:hypothetical protein
MPAHILMDNRRIIRSSCHPPVPAQPRFRVRMRAHSFVMSLCRLRRRGTFGNRVRTLNVIGSVVGSFDGQLFYVRDDSDINHVHVEAVLLCTVRVSQNSDLDLCFDLISPNKRVYTLQAETEESMKQWMAVFQNCSEALLNASGTMLTAHEQTMSNTELKEHIDLKANAVQALRKLNPTCVDCGAKGQARCSRTM